MIENEKQSNSHTTKKDTLAAYNTLNNLFFGTIFGTIVGINISSFFGLICWSMIKRNDLNIIKHFIYFGTIVGAMTGVLSSVYSGVKLMRNSGFIGLIIGLFYAIINKKKNVAKFIIVSMFGLIQGVCTGSIIHITSFLLNLCNLFGY